MNHVLEHVTSIEWNHRNQVGKSKQNVDPHDPKHQIDKDQQAFFTEEVPEECIIGLQHCFLVWMHRYTLEFEWDDHDGYNVQRSDERPLQSSVFHIRRQWPCEAIDACCIRREPLNTQEWVALFN